MSGRSVLALGLRLCDFKKGEMVVLSVRRERQGNYREKNKTDAQREAEMNPGGRGREQVCRCLGSQWGFQALVSGSGEAGLPGDMEGW